MATKRKSKMMKASLTSVLALSVFASAPHIADASEELENITPESTEESEAEDFGTTQELVENEKEVQIGEAVESSEQEENAVENFIESSSEEERIIENEVESEQTLEVEAVNQEEDINEDTLEENTIEETSEEGSSTTENIEHTEEPAIEESIKKLEADTDELQNDETYEEEEEKNDVDESKIEVQSEEENLEEDEYADYTKYYSNNYTYYLDNVGNSSILTYDSNSDENYKESISATVENLGVPRNIHFEIASINEEEISIAERINHDNKEIHITRSNIIVTVLNPDQPRYSELITDEVLVDDNKETEGRLIIRTYDLDHETYTGYSSGGLHDSIDDAIRFQFQHNVLSGSRLNEHVPYYELVEVDMVEGIEVTQSDIGKITQPVYDITMYIRAYNPSEEYLKRIEELEHYPYESANPSLINIIELKDRDNDNVITSFEIIGDYFTHRLDNYIEEFNYHNKTDFIVDETKLIDYTISNVITDEERINKTIKNYEVYVKGEQKGSLGAPIVPTVPEEILYIDETHEKAHRDIKIYHQDEVLYSFDYIALEKVDESIKRGLKQFYAAQPSYYEFTEVSVEEDEVMGYMYFDGFGYDRYFSGTSYKIDIYVDDIGSEGLETPPVDEEKPTDEEPANEDQDDTSSGKNDGNEDSNVDTEEDKEDSGEVKEPSDDSVENVENSEGLETPPVDEEKPANEVPVENQDDTSGGKNNDNEDINVDTEKGREDSDEVAESSDDSVEEIDNNEGLEIPTVDEEKPTDEEPTNEVPSENQGGTSGGQNDGNEDTKVVIEGSSDNSVGDESIIPDGASQDNQNKDNSGAINQLTDENTGLTVTSEYGELEGLQLFVEVLGLSDRIDVSHDRYEIELFDADGNEYELQNPVTVSIPENGEAINVYYLADSLVEVDFKVIDGNVVFIADSFSEYAVTYENMDMETPLSSLASDDIEVEEGEDSASTEVGIDAAQMDNGTFVEDETVSIGEVSIVDDEGVIQESEEAIAKVSNQQNQEVKKETETLPNTGIVAKAVAVPTVLLVILGAALFFLGRRRTN